MATPSTTWLFVKRYPSDRITKPVPAPPSDPFLTEMETTEGKTFAANAEIESGARSIELSTETNFAPESKREPSPAFPITPPMAPAITAIVTATLNGMYPLRFLDCLDGGNELNVLLALIALCCGAANERGTSGASPFELLGVDHQPGSLI